MDRTYSLTTAGRARLGCTNRGLQSCPKYTALMTKLLNMQTDPHTERESTHTMHYSWIAHQLDIGTSSGRRHN